MGDNTVMPLIKRTTFPPKGWMFYQPQTQWPRSQEEFAGMTFDQVVDRIIAHRAANPRFRQNWSLDVDEVSDELDLFTCVRLKFDPNYCTGGGTSPKVPPPLPGSAAAGVLGRAGRRGAAVVERGRKYIAGIAVLLDWLGSGGHTVLRELAEARAAVCAACPKNQELGTIDELFTTEAASRLKSFLSLKGEMKLSTTQDGKLKTCAACLCKPELKVWTPLEHVVKKLKPEQEAELDPKCWILTERQ